MMGVFRFESLFVTCSSRSAGRRHAQGGVNLKGVEGVFSPAFSH